MASNGNLEFQYELQEFKCGHLRCLHSNTELYNYSSLTEHVLRHYISDIGEQARCLYSVACDCSSIYHQEALARKHLITFKHDPTHRLRLLRDVNHMDKEYTDILEDFHLVYLPLLAQPIKTVKNFTPKMAEVHNFLVSLPPKVAKDLNADQRKQQKQIPTPSSNNPSTSRMSGGNDPLPRKQEPFPDNWPNYGSTPCPPLSHFWQDPFQARFPQEIPYQEPPIPGCEKEEEEEQQLPPIPRKPWNYQSLLRMLHMKPSLTTAEYRATRSRAGLSTSLLKREPSSPVEVIANPILSAPRPDEFSSLFGEQPTAATQNKSPTKQPAVTKAKPSAPARPVLPVRPPLPVSKSKKTKETTASPSKSSSKSAISNNTAEPTSEKRVRGRPQQFTPEATPAPSSSSRKPSEAPKAKKSRETPKEPEKTKTKEIKFSTLSKQDKGAKSSASSEQLKSKSTNSSPTKSTSKQSNVPTSKSSLASQFDQLRAAVEAKNGKKKEDSQLASNLNLSGVKMKEKSRKRSPTFQNARETRVPSRNSSRASSREKSVERGRTPVFIPWSPSQQTRRVTRSQSRSVTPIRSPPPAKRTRGTTPSASGKRVTRSRSGTPNRATGGEDRQIYRISNLSDGVKTRGVRSREGSVITDYSSLDDDEEDSSTIQKYSCNPLDAEATRAALEKLKKAATETAEQAKTVQPNTSFDKDAMSWDEYEEPLKRRTQRTLIRAPSRYRSPSVEAPHKPTNSSKEASTSKPPVKSLAEVSTKIKERIPGPRKVQETTYMPRRAPARCSRSRSRTKSPCP